MTKIQKMRKRVQDEMERAFFDGNFAVYEAKIREHELLAVVDKLERDPQHFQAWLYARAGL